MKVGPLGLPELLVILVILMLIFGATRVPTIGSSLGRGIRSFKTAVMGEDEEGQAESKGSSPGTDEDRA